MFCKSVEKAESFKKHIRNLVGLGNFGLQEEKNAYTLPGNASHDRNLSVVYISIAWIPRTVCDVILT